MTQGAARVWLCALQLAASPADGDAQRDTEIFGSASSTDVFVNDDAPASTDTQSASADTPVSASVQEASLGASASDGPEEAPPRGPLQKREEEMFYGPPARGYPEMGQGGAQRLNAIADKFEQALNATDNVLTLGGFIFLRSEYDLKDEPSVGWRDYPFISPNLMDFYFDARPSDRLRGYMRGRLLYSPGLGPGARDPMTLQPLQEVGLVLDQFWLKFDVARLAYFTLGRQPVRWGVGRFWNPTDFLAQFHRDSLAIFDRRVGVTLLKIHVPWEMQGWNFYGFVDLTRADTLGNLGGALRAEAAWGQSEISLSVAKHAEGADQLGFDVSTGIGWFDAHWELAAQRGVTQPFFEASDGRAFHQVLRQDTWFLQTLVGLEVSVPYGNNDTAVLGVEYFYNQLGYPSKSVYPTAAETLVQLGEAIPFLYLGRQYAAFYAFFDKPGSWNRSSVTLSVVSNFTDQSWLTRLDYQVRALTYMDVNLYGVYHLGARGGELHFGLSAYGIPTARAEVGLGLRLYF